MLCRISKCILFLALSALFALGNIAVHGSTVLDYDGDGRSDLALVRFDQGTPNFVWYILQSRDGYSAAIWGLQANDGPRFDGDYDGDGRTDITVVRFIPGDPYQYWYILNSSNNTMTALQWGLSSNDIPVSQDYDDDGKTDIAMYRLGWWLILRSSDNQPYFEQFGTSNDKPLTGGDYDGDGKADLAVVRYTPPNPPGSAIPMTLYLRLSANGWWASYNLGDARFTGVLTGDYDGDGKADVAIWQENLWLWIRSSDGNLEGVRFGQIPGDTPIPGDFDGDGKTDPAVFRRGTMVSPLSYFYLLQSRDGFKAVQWGNNHDATEGDLGGTRYIPAIGF